MPIALDSDMVLSRAFLAGEAVVLCVVVDAPSVRPVCIRPNRRARPLADGDEEVQLHVGQGDAYDMDGTMQAGYEHR